MGEQYIISGCKLLTTCKTSLSPIHLEMIYQNLLAPGLSIHEKRPIAEHNEKPGLLCNKGDIG